MENGSSLSWGVSSTTLLWKTGTQLHLAPLLDIPDKNKDANERISREEENRFKRFTKHPLPLLIRDQKVWLRDRITKRWDIPAEVRGCRPNEKMFILQTSMGGVFLRNRKMIKPRYEDQEAGEKNKEDQEAGEKEKEEGSEEEKQEGQRGAGISDFSRVQSEHMGQPARTAGPEKATRPRAKGRGGPGAGAGAGPQGQEASEVPRIRTYREALCGDQSRNGHRMVTRSMTKP